MTAIVEPMRGPPLVSVITPTYNRAGYLRQALESVFRQTFTDWEVIVADDGSTDATRAYLEGQGEPRLRVAYLPHTNRPSVVRNRALDLATGRYVAFLDADDVWLPEKLEVQLAGLRAHPECQWSYTWFGTIDADGRRTLNPRYQPWVPYRGMILERLLTFEAVLPTPSVLVERSLLEQVGRFDEQLEYCEDYDCWFRLAVRSPIWCEDQPLTLVRVHSESHSRNRPEVYRHWARVFTKTAVLVSDASVRALCRRQRARQPIILSGWYTSHGRARHGVATLLGAAGYAARYGEWWRALARAMVHSVVPEALFRSYRRLRNPAA